MATQVKLYDTTLRDGAQREGMSLSVQDKLKIARKLDEFGMHYVEAGWPGSNPKDIDIFLALKKAPLKSARLVAFGSTCRKNLAAEEDPNLKELVDSGAPTACIFGKSWDLHVTHALITTLDENLRMIQESVSYLKGQGMEVVYDAEHFFDAFKNNETYTMATLKAAAEAGADWLVLCDTNGGTLPDEIARVFRLVNKAVDLPLGIHAHNDNECGVANSLAAVSEGATQVQGTVNGYGERCGNANIISIIPNLTLKMGVDCLPPDKVAGLTELAHHVSEVANVAPDPHQPFVGDSAFAHKAGMHVSAILRQKGTYEHIDPGVVGNVQRVLLSELSGADALVHKAKEAGIDLSGQPQKVKDVIAKLKKLEHAGYHFEAADGSFEILLRKTTGAYRPLFTLESYQVNVNRSRSGRIETEAIVKLWVGENRIVELAEGNGPVNALDRALRKAVGRMYPHLSHIKLTDYKVRIVSEKKGTGAVTRVLIESTDGEHTWGTVGVSQNIIEASWEALVDAIEYGLARHERADSADADSGG